MEKAVERFEALEQRVRELEKYILDAAYQERPQVGDAEAELDEE